MIFSEALHGFLTSLNNLNYFLQQGITVPNFKTVERLFRTNYIFQDVDITNVRNFTNNNTQIPFVNLHLDTFRN